MSTAVRLSPLALALLAITAVAGSSPQPGLESAAEPLVDQTSFAAGQDCPGCGISSQTAPEVILQPAPKTWMVPALPTRPPAARGVAPSPWSRSSTEMHSVKFGSYTTTPIVGECELSESSCGQRGELGCGAHLGLAVIAPDVARPPLVDNTLGIILPDGTAMEIERDGQWHWIYHSTTGQCGVTHSAELTFENGDRFIQELGCSSCDD